MSFLIPSKVRRLVIDYFVVYPDAQVGVRELARELQQSPQMVYRELINLESFGLLLSSRIGIQRSYRLNRRFPLYPGLADMFNRLRDENTRRYEVNRVFDWNQLSKQYSKIPVPDSLIPGLTSRRRKPRSYDEEKSLRKKGLLS